MIPLSEQSESSNNPENPTSFIQKPNIGANALKKIIYLHFDSKYALPQLTGLSKVD